MNLGIRKIKKERKKNSDKLTFYYSFYLVVMVVTHSLSHQMSYCFINYNASQSFLTWAKYNNKV